VYAGWLAQLAGDGAEVERWPAAISVGSNPTFDGVERTVEAYALDRDDLDLYGVLAAIEFAERIRGQVKFAAIEDLIAQIGRDVDTVRQVLAGRVTRAVGRLLAPERRSRRRGPAGRNRVLAGLAAAGLQYLRAFSVRGGWSGAPVRVSRLPGTTTIWPGDTIGLALDGGVPGRQQVAVSWGSAPGGSDQSSIWTAVVRDLP
jgi:Riboflavin kinase